jgi:hypothetical protein
LPEASIQGLEALSMLADNGDLNLKSVQDSLLGLNDTAQLGLADQLPRSTLATLNAFGMLSDQGRQHFSDIGSAISALSGTAVDDLGGAVPGAATTTGTHLNALQLVTNRLKAEGFDPANVSIGQMFGALQGIQNDVPGLSPVLQGLIEKLNAIPRDIHINITSSGIPEGTGIAPRGSSGGGPISRLSGGNGGQGNVPGATSRGGYGTTRTNNGGVGGPGQFASGGWPPVGMASLVGENGPELFVPSVPGQIIPNDDLRGIGGGGVGTVIVQINGTMDLTNPTQVSRLADVVGNEVMRSIRIRTGLGKVM